MYLYLSIFDEDSKNPEKQRLVSIESQAAAIAKVLNDEKEKATDDNDPYGGGGGGRRRRNYYNDENPNDDPLDLYFTQAGFQGVLSWSHNVSGYGISSRYRTYARSNIGEITVSRWADKHTPLMYVSSLRGEIFPFAIIRSVGEIKEGKIRVVEYEFRNVSIVNLSVSGSSGDRNNESISFSFLSFFSRYIDIDAKTGDIMTIMSGFWDEESESGSRDGHQALPSLSLLCRRIIAQNLAIYDKKDLHMLVKMKLFTKEEIPVDLSSYSLPLRGRRLYVSPKDDQQHFKQVNVRPLDLESLKKAIAEKFKKEPKTVYLLSSRKFLIEIENDGQVEDFVDDSFVVAEF